MKLKKMALITVCLTLSSIAYAGGSTGVNTIKQLYVTGNGLLNIVGTTAFGNPDGCDRSDRLYYPTSFDGVVIPDIRAQISATVIAAKLKGANISFTVSGCYDYNGVTYPRVINAVLEP